MICSNKFGTKCEALYVSRLNEQATGLTTSMADEAEPSLYSCT